MRWFMAITALITSASVAVGQTSTINILSEYAYHQNGERLNTPQDEIKWLKEHQFTHGELDNFPQKAIILHRVDVDEYLKRAGFTNYYVQFSYGFTDPGLIFIVRKPDSAPFAVVRGLPGAGGVTTIAAELQAMGATTVIHIGTAGLLSPDVPWGNVIVSSGSYKDGGAFLLDKNLESQISYPNPDVTKEIFETLKEDNIPAIEAAGFTMPVYYFQPGSILRKLLNITGAQKPTFIEMEEAPFFAVSNLVGIRAASMVVASDRLENQNGALSQAFWGGDLDGLEFAAFQEAIRFFNSATTKSH